MLCIVVVESINEVYQLKEIEVTKFMCEVLCLSSKELSLPLLFTVALVSEASIFSVVFVSPLLSLGFPRDSFLCRV